MDDGALFQKYRETGDVSVRNEIAEKYLYIASVLAKKFAGRGVEYDDLYQIAALALIKGVERFEPEKGVKFSTFITPTITGEIKNYFRDRSRLVHLPRSVSELRARIRDAAEAITLETGKHPSAREIAVCLNLSEEEIVRAQEAGSVVSLDATVGTEEEGASFHERLAAKDDGAIERIENRDALEAAMRGFSARERALLELRFGEALSQTETAKRMGVSQMYVSRLERKLLERLRENMRKGMAE
ncbi:MAG: sigma-70 family RNA polymerase sigma factor [Clostridia bacterium]|nr:sigma-70 family RNA polymerase sigma factor [Clostridia bacterium]